MAGARKDNKGRVLLKGESYREKDERYQFKYTDSMGRTKYIYSKDIITLRKREEELMILSILVYTLFSRMFDLMQPPVVKHSIAVA